MLVSGLSNLPPWDKDLSVEHGERTMMDIKQIHFSGIEKLFNCVTFSSVSSNISRWLSRGRAPARGLFQRLSYYDEEPNSLGDILELDEYPGVISYGGRPWELLELLNAEDKRGGLKDTNGNAEIRDATQQASVLKEIVGKK
ncbi:hypothetical protein ElyMa_000275900 [Elysia marginata]|uniref:Uncharacterized protein n=1 Tax=Elysia marginata TaxID=1093978 RepID=A0AAV4F5R5_9GAST|nr:hypothetical protein ElyMa_000275900 [Elysia marginata]